MQKSHSNCFKMASFDRIKFRISHVPVVCPPCAHSDLGRQGEHFRRTSERLLQEFATLRQGQSPVYSSVAQDIALEDNTSFRLLICQRASSCGHNIELQSKTASCVKLIIKISVA